MLVLPFTKWRRCFFRLSSFLFPLSIFNQFLKERPIARLRSWLRSIELGQTWLKLLHFLKLLLYHIIHRGRVQETLKAFQLLLLPFELFQSTIDIFTTWLLVGTHLGVVIFSGWYSKCV